jgi:hypothetical protein
MVILYTFSRSGISHKDKSGNPALKHVNITIFYLWLKLGADLRRADGLAQLARDAPLLAAGVPPQRMLASESGK